MIFEYQTEVKRLHPEIHNGALKWVR
jgi:hypothetical protein